MRLLSIPARMILRQQLLVIGFVMFTLLIVAYSIDLAQNMADLKARGTGLYGTARYLAFRGIDIVTRLLPMACLAGAFMAELMRRQRLEPVILSAAGASPVMTLKAMALLGLGLGAAQATLEAYLRPAAVFAQVDMGLGRYASRFAPGLTDPQWLADEGRVLRARMARGADPDMQAIMLFSGLDGQSPLTITTARSARPASAPETWTLQEVTVWGAAGHPAQTRPTATLHFPLSAAHLRYFGVPALYLPQTALRQVAGITAGPAPHDAQTALLRRYAALFLPGICALLGAALGQAAWRERRLDIFRAVGLAALGYASVVSVKIFWALGEHGAIAPLWAAFGGAIWMAALALGLLLRQR